MTTQIGDLIADALVTKLTADLITAIEGNPLAAGSEKFGLVRKGHLQDDPEKHRLLALVHPAGDPDEEDWKDISLAYFEQQPERRQMFFHYAEVGGPYGATSWYRRGVVEMQFFFTKTKEDRDLARQIALVSLARIERALSQANTAALMDDFGETCIFPVKPMFSRLEEGGGPKSSFIHRGKVGYQAVTERGY